MNILYILNNIKNFDERKEKKIARLKLSINQENQPNYKKKNNNIKIYFYIINLFIKIVILFYYIKYFLIKILNFFIY